MKITLKDDSYKEYAQAMSIYEIAADISEGLASGWKGRGPSDSH